MMDEMSDSGVDTLTQLEVLAATVDGALKTWEHGCLREFAERYPAIDRLVELAQRLMPVLDEEQSANKVQAESV
jgi:hypothetical protein